MTEESSALLFIQCDWDTILSETGAVAWISCKSKDNPGVHGKIRTVRCLPDPPSVNASDGFEIDNVSASSLTVRHQNSPFTTVFLAPHRTFPAVHKGSVGCLDVNNEGLAVSYSSEGQLLVWDTRTEEIKLILKGHLSDVYRCKFYPSGKVVLSCGSDMTLRIWCAKTGQCPVTLKGHTMAVTDMDFIGRGRNVLSTSKDGKVKLWHCGDGACIGNVASVSSSINCCQVQTAPSYLELGERKLPRNEKEIDTEDKIVVYGCENGTVECVSIGTRRILFSIHHESAVNCINFIDKETFVIGCQDGKVFSYSLKNVEQGSHKWEESNSSVLAVLSYKSHREEVNGVFVSRADGTVTFLPLNNVCKRLSLTGPNCDPVYNLASDGKNVFTCCRDGSIRLYTLETVIKTF